jgi:hypothetical protein
MKMAMRRVRPALPTPEEEHRCQYETDELRRRFQLHWPMRAHLQNREICRIILRQLKIVERQAWPPIEPTVEPALSGGPWPLIFKRYGIRRPGEIGFSGWTPPSPASQEHYENIEQALEDPNSARRFCDWLELWREGEASVDE